MATVGQRLTEFATRTVAEWSALDAARAETAATLGALQQGTDDALALLIDDVATIEAALPGKADDAELTALASSLQEALALKQPVGSYLSAITAPMVTGALGFTPQPVGAYLTGITGGQVTAALGFTPQPQGNYLTSLVGMTSLNVTAALGYTPQPAGTYATGGGTATGTNTGDQFTNIPASRLLGRTAAGFGAASDLSVADVKTLLGVATANGIASLGADGKVPAAQLPTSTGGSDPWAWLKLAADHSNATVTPANSSGMSFTAAPNTTYLVELIGSFTSSLATAGIGLQLDIPSGSVAGMFYGLGTTAQTMTVGEQIADAALTNAGTIGVRAINTITPVQGKWLVSVGATGGTVQLQMRAEVAATVVLKAGTALGYRVI